MVALILDIYARVSRLGDDRQRSTEGQVEDCQARIVERARSAKCTSTVGARRGIRA
jgi:hypothetical protein